MEEGLCPGRMEVQIWQKVLSDLKSMIYLIFIYPVGLHFPVALAVRCACD